MQMQNSLHRSVLSCFRTLYHNEGISAFYISYPTTLTMNVPFTAVQFSVYEGLKEAINPSGEYSPITHVVAGGVAGGVAAAVTTPLDVAKVSFWIFWIFLFFEEFLSRPLMLNPPSPPHTPPITLTQTLLQTRGSSTDPVIRSARSMTTALRIIYDRDGFRGLRRGMSPRVLTFAPSTAISWASYEFFSEWR